jgi:tRNA(Ile)-lysidine synthase
VLRSILRGAEFVVVEKFKNTVKEYDLISPGDRVLIAVSGGVDSTALLHLLASLRDEYKLSLHVTHLNHMIRKGDADLDVKYVKEISGKLSIPVTVEACDVQAMAKKRKMGLEVTARHVRYDFFERTAENIGATRIAVGHNADDNVETFLMRMLRGAGLKGLCGITPKRGKIIRPMIKCWRKELEEYVGSLKLVPRRDYTNYESKYMRNRVRMKLLPQLRLYNLNIKEIILQTILLLTEDSGYLETNAEEILSEVLVSDNGDEVRLNIEKIRALSFSMQGRIIRLAVEKVKGDLMEVSYVHIRDILKQLEANEGWELHLPAGVFVTGHHGELIFGRERPAMPEVQPFRYSVRIPGSVKIKELGKEFKATVEKERGNSDSGNMVYVDYAALGKTVTVRNRKDGDRFNPLGMDGTKKIQDLFVDEKIPAEQRDLIPIIESGGKVVWVGGVRLDDRAKVTDKTKKVVKLELV